MSKSLLFPTSVIGSLPRPQFVKDLIADDCLIVGDEYRRLMGAAIRTAVALQETAGLDVVTDGEWWRKSYIGVIAELATALNSAAIRRTAGRGRSLWISSARSDRASLRKRSSS